MKPSGKRHLSTSTNTSWVFTLILPPAVPYSGFDCILSFFSAYSRWIYLVLLFVKLIFWLVLVLGPVILLVMSSSPFTVTEITSLIFSLFYAFSPLVFLLGGLANESLFDKLLWAICKVGSLFVWFKVTADFKREFYFVGTVVAKLSCLLNSNSLVPKINLYLIWSSSRSFYIISYFSGFFDCICDWFRVEMLFCEPLVLFLADFFIALDLSAFVTAVKEFCLFRLV